MMVTRVDEQKWRWGRRGERGRSPSQIGGDGNPWRVAVMTRCNHHLVFEKWLEGLDKGNVGIPLSTHHSPLTTHHFNPLFLHAEF